MLQFANLPIEERIPYFQEVASRRNLTSLVVEKDFWVCFILKNLFSNPDLKDFFIFKGGTSLSKVFGIIKRFSEDIDLTLDPKWLGFDEKSLPSFEKTITKRKKCREDLKIACANKVRDRIQPILEEAVIHQIGPPKSHENYFDYNDNAGSLIFRYPTSEVATRGYIVPQVKLEIGSHTGIAPNDRYTITSWVAEEFQDLFKELKVAVVSLGSERTFWEKATILHAEYHRPPESKMRHHLSRDIYDLYKMALHESGQNAIKDFKLLEEVVTHKQLYFYTKWANCTSAKPGTLRLTPPDHRIPELETDYRNMQEMFFETPPEFDELLAQLRTIEETINAS